MGEDQERVLGACDVVNPGISGVNEHIGVPQPACFWVLF